MNTLISLLLRKLGLMLIYCFAFEVYEENSNSSSGANGSSDGGPVNPPGIGQPDDPFIVIWSTNIRGMGSNFDDLLFRVNSAVKEPDLIFVNESLIDPKKLPPSGVYELPGYDMHRLDRKRAGGGNVVY